MNWLSGVGGACRIETDPAGDWRVLPPPGQIFRVGDAGAPGEAADNDSFFVSGKLEVGAGPSFLQGLTILGSGFSRLRLRRQSEEMIIPVGQGMLGIDTVTAWFEAGTLVFAVAARVTQAPGGGATTWNLYRQGGANGEFAQNMPVALGTTSVWYTDFGALADNLIFQDTADEMRVKTNANVTGTDMKLRFEFFFFDNDPPTA